ncbi:MAG TPA: flagellar hook-basal body protein [Anaerovoracaceae bacterium]|nr:flagellar hook-basal body protein [Anaerovoracaceae bacterium]
MIRGLYAAAAGVFTQQKALNVISNNIANASTAGYKSQATVESSFGEHLINRMSELESVAKKDIGSWSYITVNSSEYTDFSQGSLESTGRPVDMAINGDGFFLVESETYGPVLTRNGQFEIDSDGELYLPGVGKVLNDGESTISLESGNFTVSPTGTIFVDGDEADNLYIVKPAEETVMKSVGNGVFQIEEGGSYDQVEEGTYNVMQGTLEKSNINMAQEMSRLIAGQNHYNSCTQIIKMYDKINEITVNQIGRIG